VSHEQPSDEDGDDHLSLVAVAERAPFPVFGLTEEFCGKRELNGVGRSRDIVNHVRLSHGLFTQTRVDVAVFGPLHDASGSADPLLMIAVELLDRTDVDLATGAGLGQAASDILGRGFEDGEIRVDGAWWPFRFLRRAAHWAAVHEMQPDHVLYVVASNVAPSEVELRRLDTLGEYA
jgi:hypothetical protein